MQQYLIMRAVWAQVCGWIWKSHFKCTFSLLSKDNKSKHLYFFRRNLFRLRSNQSELSVKTAEESHSIGLPAIYLFKNVTAKWNYQRSLKHMNNKRVAKYDLGWIDKWMGVEAVLRIAYSYQNCSSLINKISGFECENLLYAIPTVALS